jgi:hypothetical protein
MRLPLARLTACTREKLRSVVPIRWYPVRLKVVPYPGHQRPGASRPVRASRAYITSLGTTSVLIASSLLMLILVSTFVAFHAWPGDDIVSGLRGLVVDESEPSLELTGPAQVAAQAAPTAASVTASPPPGTPLLAAGAAGPGGLGPTGTPLGTIDPRSGIPTPTSPGNPQQNSGSPSRGGFTPTQPGPGAILPPSTPDVRPLTGRLGESTRRLTGSLGTAVGRVSPGLGRTVTQTGETLSNLLHGLGRRLAPRTP